MTKPDSARQALIDYLSVQPERTALSRDCRREVERVLGRRISAELLSHAKRTLGVTHRFGSLGSEPGSSFVSYWTLPEENTSRITERDRCMAETLVRATTQQDSEEVGVCLEYGLRRPRQMLLALAQLAAER